MTENAGIEGKVRVKATVDANGTVTQAEVIGGPMWPCGTDPETELEAVRTSILGSVRDMKFPPAMKNGKPHSTDLFLTFTVGKTYDYLLKDKQTDEGVRKGSPRDIESDILGKALDLPQPGYPFNAGSSRNGGPVSVQVIIDERGRVLMAGTMSGNSLFHKTARDAACGSRFSPTVIKGEPVKVSGVITYNFKR